MNARTYILLYGSRYQIGQLDGLLNFVKAARLKTWYLLDFIECDVILRCIDGGPVDFPALNLDEYDRKVIIRFLASLYDDATDGLDPLSIFAK